MKTITKLSLALSLAYAGSAAAVDITIGHVDSQDWTISKKVPLLKYLKIS